MVTALRISGLYAITPDWDDDGRLYDAVELALRGGVRILQYRDKCRDGARAMARALQLRQSCDRHGALFIVNDDVSLCEQSGADGVHLGRDDAQVSQARARLGAGRIIGVSCYDDLARARAARRTGADYVAFGSVFASTVKPQAVRAPLALFGQARTELDMPLVAIGGIDLQNAAAVLAAGADALAVISALFEAPDVEDRARGFSKLCSSIHHSQSN